MGIDSALLGEKLTIKEAADRVGMAPRTLWRYLSGTKVRRYTIPGRGKLTHVDIDEVKRELARPRVKS